MAQSKASAVDDEVAAPAAKAAPSGPAKSGGMMLLIGAVVISTAASAGISWFFSHRTEAAMQASLAHAAEGEGGEASAEKPKSPPLYQTMEPAFVVNLDAPDHARYLQTQIELMARDSAALEAVGRYNPRIRNAILLLLGQQQVADLTTREGKEKLQTAVLGEIQKILKEETGSPGVEAVYFSSFVMQ